MTRDNFLTLRWNNLLSLGLGLPALVYVIFVLSTAVLSNDAAFVGIAVIGSLY